MIKQYKDLILFKFIEKSEEEAKQALDNFILNEENYNKYIYIQSDACPILVTKGDKTIEYYTTMLCKELERKI